MPRQSGAAAVLPPAVAQALRALGENLAIARVRRRQSQRVWAQRLGVSVPTLIRLERGDPGVSLGVLATALWLVGHAQALPELAAPAADRGALEADVREAVSRRAARSKGAAKAQAPRGNATQAAHDKPRPARRSRA